MMLIVSYETNFIEEDILQASKEGNLQQEDPWVICFISEDNEVVYEQQKTSLQFPINFQQQIISLQEELSQLQVKQKDA